MLHTPRKVFFVHQEIGIKFVSIGNTTKGFSGLALVC